MVAQVILQSIMTGSNTVPELQLLLQNDAEAAVWTQEATRLLGPSQPISSGGSTLDHSVVKLCRKGCML